MMTIDRRCARPRVNGAIEERRAIDERRTIDVCLRCSGVRANVNARSVEGVCGTERDELHGRVDRASASRGDGTATHRDTAVNGRAMGRKPTERERVLAFSPSVRPTAEAR